MAILKVRSKQENCQYSSAFTAAIALVCAPLMGEMLDYASYAGTAQRSATEALTSLAQKAATSGDCALTSLQGVQVPYATSHLWFLKSSGFLTISEIRPDAEAKINVMTGKISDISYSATLSSLPKTNIIDFISDALSAKPGIRVNVQLAPCKRWDSLPVAELK